MLVALLPAPAHVSPSIARPVTRRYSVYLMLAALVVSLAVISLLVGDDGYTGGSRPLAGPPPLPDAQQVVRIPLAGSGTISTLDPAVATDPNALQATQLIFPSLVTLDDGLRPVPWAAASIDLSPDGLVYTFHLRPNLTWSDGSPLDAATFAYSLNRALHPCTHSPVAYYLFPIKDAVRFNMQRCNPDGSLSPAPGQGGDVLGSLVGDSLVARNAHTLVVTLAQPVAYFLAALAYPVAAAIPQRLLDRYGGDWTVHLTDGGGLGGNLFVVRTWKDGDLVLARNARFWGTKPTLRQIEFIPTTDAGAAYAAYLAGKTQIGFAPPDHYAAARTHRGFAETGLLQIDYYGLNWQQAPFDDLRMRQAFALALDPAALATGTLHGLAAPTRHIVPAGMPGYNPNLTGPGGAPGLTADPVKARSLAASYAQDKCGGVLSKCPAVVLTVPSGDSRVAAQAQAAISMWHDAIPGYPITLATLDQNALLAALADHGLQLWYMTWIADYPDPQDWLTNQFLPGTYYDDGNVNLPDATREMLAGDITRDPTLRMQRYQAAEQLLVTTVAWISLDQPKLWWETAPQVVGFQLDGSDLATLGVWQRVYLAKT